MVPAWLSRRCGRCLRRWRRCPARRSRPASPLSRCDPGCCCCSCCCCFSSASLPDLHVHAVSNGCAGSLALHAPSPAHRWPRLSVVAAGPGGGGGARCGGRPVPVAAGGRQPAPDGVRGAPRAAGGQRQALGRAGPHQAAPHADGARQRGLQPQRGRPAAVGGPGSAGGAQGRAGGRGGSCRQRPLVPFCLHLGMLLLPAPWSMA